MVSRIMNLFGRRKMDDDCVEVRERCSDYIDGELDTAFEDRIKAHLARCGPCDSFVKTLMATVEMLKGTPKQAAPQGFRQRIKEQLGEEKRHG